MLYYLSGLICDAAADLLLIGLLENRTVYCSKLDFSGADS